MTVIRPNSISGVSSITGSGGDISIFRADGTPADVIVNNITSGIITATHYGSGANLTNLPSAQLTGTIDDARLSTVSSSKLSGALPALDGSALTGVGASFGNSSVNTSGIITATAFVPTTGQLSHRNIAINGAMNVAQRGTSSGTSDYATVDRFGWDAFAMGASATQSQSDVASGTTPYSLGFRKAFRLTIGNNGSPAASTRVGFFHKIEAQDIANSGWNYTSSSSYITFSYWVKSSVAQNFYNTFKNDDGSSQRYVTETGSLTADTWTKITKTIPGNSNLTFNNDNGEGLEITWELFRGTNQTGTRPLNAWAASDNNTRTPDQASTWYSTNGATFEITGVQLEVGPVATSFEHRSFSDELARCMRYYQTSTDDWHSALNSNSTPSAYSNCNVPFKVQMRAAPTVNYVWTGNGGNTPTSQSTNYIGVNSFVALSLANSSSAFRLDSWTCNAEL